MPKVKIELPAVDADDTIEVELTVNGEKRTMTYRIDIFDWQREAHPGEERALVLKRMIEGYEEGWRLVQIGAPTEREIPVMFQQVQEVAR